MESSCRQPKTSKDSFRLRDTEVLNITRKTMVGKQKLSYTQQFVNKMPAFFVLADWQVEMYYCERVREGSVTVRDRVYLFLASPSSSTGGMLIGFAVWLISAASVFISAAQTIDEVAARARYDEDGGMPGGVEAKAQAYAAWNVASLVIMLLDALLRLWSYRQPLRDSFVVLDLISLIPALMRVSFRFSTTAMPGVGMLGLYFSQPSVGVAQLVHAVAALASLRLLKFTSMFLGTSILITAVKESLSALMIPAYLMLLLFTFFGSLAFAVEYDPVDALSNGARVSDLSEAWWMLYVTMTTTGYGDFSPQTALGRLLVGCSMFVGICFMAMPLAIVGNTFGAAWEGKTILMISDQIKRGLLENGHSVYDVLTAFSTFDRNGDGSITYKEFKKTLRSELGVILDEVALRGVWRHMDLDVSGEVGFEEFCSTLFPEFDESAILEVVAESADKMEKMRQDRMQARQDALLALHADDEPPDELTQALTEALSTSEEATTTLGSKIVTSIASRKRRSSREVHENCSRSTPSALSDLGTNITAAPSELGIPVGSEGNSVEADNQAALVTDRLRSVERSLEAILQSQHELRCGLSKLNNSPTRE